jgi:ATP-binding cassette subfamily B protein
MDEATSNLDVLTEEAIIRSINELKDTTILIIAHRLKTIKNCDSIIVLDGKGDVKTGTHEELLEKSDLYANFFKS